MDEMERLLASWDSEVADSAPRPDEIARMGELIERMSLMSRELIFIEEEQRRKFARLLHEGPLQYCTAAAMRLEAVKNNADAKLAGERIQEAMKGLKDLEFRLAPEALTVFGLASTLERLVQKKAAENGWELSLALSNDLPRLCGVLESAIFRATLAFLELATPPESTRGLMVSLNSEAGELRFESRFSSTSTPTSGGAGEFATELDNCLKRIEALGGNCQVLHQRDGACLSIEFPRASYEDRVFGFVKEGARI